jgi:hypothetical protein
MDDDEVMSEEEDLGESLVPGPKPLVDISKLHIRMANTQADPLRLELRPSKAPSRPRNQGHIYLPHESV